MGIKTKFALATAFVAVAAMAATAFGEGGTATPTARPSEQNSTAEPKEPREPRRGTAERRAQRRDERRCPPARKDGRGMRLVHRESKFQVREGFAQVTIDQGKITKIDGRTVTIKRLDGENVTATATDETKVCKDGEPATFAALEVGDLARLIQVRSPRVNGLSRITAITPSSDSSTASPSDFSGEEFAELSGEIY